MPSAETAVVVRIFLALVGLAYLVLAIWCVARMGQTSESIGYTLRPGAGQSEYFTVYGGLEVGLAIVFFWPLFQPAQTGSVLGLAVILHAAIVVFRVPSLFLFGGETTTHAVAAIELAILATASALAWWTR